MTLSETAVRGPSPRARWRPCPTRLFVSPHCAYIPFRLWSGAPGRESNRHSTRDCAARIHPLSICQKEPQRLLLWSLAIPSRNAANASWTRLCTLSLVRALSRWVPTVAGAMPSRSPSSRLVRPSVASSRTTSVSRGVSSHSPVVRRRFAFLPAAGDITYGPRQHPNMDTSGKTRLPREGAGPYDSPRLLC